MSETQETADPGTDTVDPTEVKARREKRREDRVRTTTRISESVRYVGYGLVAVTFSLLLSDSEFAKDLVENHKSLLVTGAIWGCVSILLDYVQYLAGYIAAIAAGASSEGNYKNSRKARFFRGARLVFFCCKQFAVVVGVLYLLTVLQKSL